jgi:hypothetical protein
VDARFLTPDDPAWPATLDSAPSDVYHLPGYVRLEADRLGGEAVAALVEGDGHTMLVPLVLRPLPPELNVSGSRDATSPYGYPGPVVSPGAPPGFGGAAGAALIELLADHAVCATFIRLNPLMPARRGLFAGNGAFVDHGSTVWIDLARNDEEYLSGMNSSTRNLIRRTERDGYTARMDDSSTALDNFHALYTRTMERVGATDEYFFTREYVDELVSVSGDRFYLCVVDYEDDLVAAAMFFDSPIAVQYHLSAAARGTGPASPTRLLLDYARRYFKEKGRIRMHLGGGVGSSEDSLFKFKASFSDGRATFETWRAITSPKRYEAAMAAWTDRTGEPAPADAAGWFPGYRRPIPE